MEKGGGKENRRECCQFCLVWCSTNRQICLKIGMTCYLIVLFLMSALKKILVFWHSFCCALFSWVPSLPAGC